MQNAEVILIRLFIFHFSVTDFDFFGSISNQ